MLQSEMHVPAEHPERRALNAEMHARPPEALPPSATIDFIALTESADSSPVEELCRFFGAPPPPRGSSHHSVNLGPFHLKWEKHTEFVRYKFVRAVDPGTPLFEGLPLQGVPADWLASLPGRMLAASRIELRPKDSVPEAGDAISERYFSGNALVGAGIAGGMGMAYGDFRICPDGFSRFIVLDSGMTARQRGRTMQRLVEIDAYCMMSLLTLPVARHTMSRLSVLEAELDEITNRMRDVVREEEPVMLDRITLLHGKLVSEQTASQFRFSAAKAYSQLIAFRLEELREVRIEGIQTFREFMARRLDPAMRTCEAAARRLATVSESVAYATQLLQTRVDVTREAQNQALLESMDRRARLQLRLQETVEGLSVAAITYYIVGIVGYIAAGLYAAQMLPIDKSLTVLLSIPVVVLFVAWSVRRARKRMSEG